MSNELILSLIMTVTAYCDGPGKQVDFSSRSCFQKVWNCGHKVKDSMAMVAETHNCITKHINGKL